MSEKKPLPLNELIKQKRRNPCPVCGHASYSSSGIHPQCIGDLADKKRRQRLAEESRKALQPPVDCAEHSPRADE